MKQRSSHPSIVDAEVTRLRQVNARLREEVRAVSELGVLIPSDYALALSFAQFCAIGRPVTDEPGRGHARSQPPPRNAAACAVLKRERDFLVSRSRELRSATERAVERPDAAWQRHP